MYQRDDIVSVPFPFTDLTQTKLRPALVISNDIVGSTTDVIIVMITSKKKNDLLSLPILDSDLSFPLPKDSFVNCHKIVTVSSTLIQKKICEGNAAFVDTVSKTIYSLISAEATIKKAVT